jgi:hypothetical protein
MKYGDEAVKKLVSRVKPVSSAGSVNPSGNVILVELAFSLSESGQLESCMCAFYDDLAMSLSIRQRTRLLVMLNRINNDSCRHCSPAPALGSAPPVASVGNHTEAPSTTPSVPETKPALFTHQHIAFYKCPPSVVCPYLFKILDWLHKEGDISIGRYQKKVKRAMESVSDYLALLHEKAMSPLNLGLRALIVCTASS